jgi:hypothetical protein
MHNKPKETKLIKKLLKRIFILLVVIFVVLIDSLGSSQGWWVYGKASLWFILISITIRLVRALKIGLYKTFPGRGSTQRLIIYRAQNNKVYWISIVAELIVWLFLVWLTLFFA